MKIYWANRSYHYHTYNYAANSLYQDKLQYTLILKKLTAKNTAIACFLYRKIQERTSGDRGCGQFHWTYYWVTSDGWASACYCTVIHTLMHIYLIRIDMPNTETIQVSKVSQWQDYD